MWETPARPLELFGSATAAERSERVRDLLQAVQLPEGHVGHYAHELSGGEKQRVAVAQAFAADPELIVCDEPVSTLDISVQAAMLNLLLDLRERTGGSLPLHLPRPLGRPLSGRPRAGDVHGAPLRGGQRGRPVRAAVPFPHRGPAVRDPAAGPSVSPAQDLARGPCSEPGGFRAGLPLPGARGSSARLRDGAPPAREAAPGHVIVCHIPLEELRRVPPVIEDRPVVAAPPGGP
jgi:ABC transporter family protein